MENTLRSPGSHTQECRSHWSEQRLWAGQGDDTQGFPTLQPLSTLTALDGRGRGGPSGRTPKRTPCREQRLPVLPTNVCSFSKTSCRPHLYASSYPVLYLSGAQHTSHMQMFHLQSVNLISDDHRSLMCEGGREGRWKQMTVINSCIQTLYMNTPF